MTFSFEERPESRSVSLLGDQPTAELVYKAVGNANELEVQAYALGATPRFVSTYSGTLYRQTIGLIPDGFAQYIVTVPYGRNKRDNGDFTFDFDTTGGTVNIKAGKEHIASYPEDMANPDPLGGCLNVKEDGEVEGAEIVIPALRFSVRFRHPAGVVTLDYVKLLSNATGRMNSATFLGFAPGELLFVGASGSDGSEADAEISYQFIASANATGITVGGVTGIDKLGHNYLSIESADAVADGGPGKEVKRVHIDRVYESMDFAAVLGWGG